MTRPDCIVDSISELLIFVLLVFQRNFDTGLVAALPNEISWPYQVSVMSGVQSGMGYMGNNSSVVSVRDPVKITVGCSDLRVIERGTGRSNMVNDGAFGNMAITGKVSPAGPIRVPDTVRIISPGALLDL